MWGPELLWGLVSSCEDGQVPHPASLQLGLEPRPVGHPPWGLDSPWLRQQQLRNVCSPVTCEATGRALWRRCVHCIARQASGQSAVPVLKQRRRGWGDGCELQSWLVPITTPHHTTPGPLPASSSLEQAGGQAWGWCSGLVLQARSRCVSSACLCNSPISLHTGFSCPLPGCSSSEKALWGWCLVLGGSAAEAWKGRTGAGQMPRVSPAVPLLPSLIPQMLFCHLNGKWVRSWQGRGCLSRRLGDAGCPLGAQGSDSRLCFWGPEVPGPLPAISSLEPAGGHCLGEGELSSGLVLAPAGV